MTTGSEALWDVMPLSVDTVWHPTLSIHSINTLEFTQLSNGTALHFKQRSVAKNLFIAKKIQIYWKVVFWNRPLWIPQITGVIREETQTCTSGFIIQTSQSAVAGKRHGLAPVTSSLFYRGDPYPFKATTPLYRISKQWVTNWWCVSGKYCRSQGNLLLSRFKITSQNNGHSKGFINIEKLLDQVNNQIKWNLVIMTSVYATPHL